MRIKLLLLIASTSALTIAHGLTFTANTNLQIYNGNGNSGFGGAIGGAALELNDDGTNISGTLTKGSGDFNDSLVIFIDSVPGGFSDTSALTDVGDTGRRNASWGATNTLTFESGFEADYAISFDVGDFLGLFQLGTPTNTFVTGIGAAGSATDATFSLDFSLADIGIAANDSFNFIGLYWNPTGGTGGFQSDEAFGVNITGGNVGSNSFAVPEPSNYALLFGCTAMLWIAVRRR